MNAFTYAWNFLKADPEMQITGRGTAPPAIQGMMSRRHKKFLPEQMTPQPPDVEGRPYTHVPSESDPSKYSAVGTAPWLAHQREEPAGPTVQDRPMTDVHRPVEPFREHLQTNPEESFLTPTERWQAQQGIAANLRRNVGGQQRGQLMGPMRHKLDTHVGVARGMRVKPHVKQFEEEKPAKLTEEQEFDAALARIAAEQGFEHKPANLPPAEEKEEVELRGGVGAVARRKEMDDRMRASAEKPDLSGIELDPTYSALMGMDPSLSQEEVGQQLSGMGLGQDELKEKLFQMALEQARQSYGVSAAPKPPAPQQDPAITAMEHTQDKMRQAGIDRGE